MFTRGFALRVPNRKNKAVLIRCVYKFILIRIDHISLHDGTCLILCCVYTRIPFAIGLFCVYCFYSVEGILFPNFVKKL